VTGLKKIGRIKGKINEKSSKEKAARHEQVKQAIESKLLNKKVLHWRKKERGLTLSD